MSRSAAPDIPSQPTDTPSPAPERVVVVPGAGSPAAPAKSWQPVVWGAVLGATAVGLRWAARPQAVRTITMGPGGWVSFKGAAGTVPSPSGRRPWWALVLRAQPLQAGDRQHRRT
jgi:hypothetical protein